MRANPDSAGRKLSAKRYLANLQGEIDSAALYRGLSEIEPRPEIAGVYQRLADIEQAHAEFWKKRLSQLGHDAPELRSRRRTRALVWFARRFGPGFVLPIATSLERGGSGYYDTQPEAVAGSLPAAERSHARLMEALAAPVPTLSIAALTRLEGRHRMGTATALRAAVLGANDGLVSNLSLVMGVAGASMTPHTILVTGLAGLIAGACAMAMGEWLSVNTSTDNYLRQIEVRAEEFSQIPDDEKEQLIRIYRAKGLTEAEAAVLADRLISSADSLLNPQAMHQLPINPGRLGDSPWIAAGSSFLLFASGAIFPVLPFLFLSGREAVVVSIILSALALFLIGAGTTLFTGRNFIWSGMRQLLIGMAAAAVTYGLGRLVGVTTAG
jgi:vacuolar iron transporter family protein